MSIQQTVVDWEKRGKEAMSKGYNKLVYPKFDEYVLKQLFNSSLPMKKE